MKRRRRLTVKQKGYICLSIAIGMMLFVFFSSNMTYTQQSSKGFLQVLLPGKPFEDALSTIHLMYANTRVSVQSMGYYGFLEFFIRKFAHFMSFFIIGFGWAYGLRTQMKDRGVSYGIAILITVGYAFLDEWHQSLTPERTALLADVLLDSFGGVLAILLVWLKKK